MSLTDFMSDFAANSLDTYSREVIKGTATQTNETRQNNDKQSVSGEKDDLFSDFSHDDDILRSLIRDYRENVSNYNKIEHEYGEESPMADVARDTMETSRACVETRIQELTLAGEDLTHAPPLEAKKEKSERKLTLDSALSLKKRREFELKLLRKQEQEKRDRNSEIATVTLMGFFLLYTWLWEGKHMNRREIAGSFMDTFHRASSAA